MADKTWMGVAPVQLQTALVTVDAGSITGGTVDDDTYTLRLTGDDDATSDASVVVASGLVGGVAATEAAVITALYNAILAVQVTAPLWRRVAVTDNNASTPKHVLVACVNSDADKGRPFALTCPSANLVVTAGAANSGPRDWGTAFNWAGQVAPVDTDSVFVPAGASANIEYGLATGRSLAVLDLRDGNGVNIGRLENASGYDGKRHWLQMTLTTKLRLAGQGSHIAIEAAASTVPVEIDHSGAPSSGQEAVIHLAGSGFTTLDMRNGYVELGREKACAFSGDLSVVGGVLILGAGFTIGGGKKVKVQDAKVYCYAANIDFEVSGAAGEFWQLAGAMGAGVVRNYGRAVPHVAGVTHGNCTVHANGVYDLTTSNLPRAVGTITVNDGGDLKGRHLLSAGTISESPYASVKGATAG